MKEKIKKEYLRKKQKTIPDKTLKQEPCQRDKYLSFLPRKILRTISVVDQRRTPQNGPKKQEN